MRRPTLIVLIAVLAVGLSSLAFADYYASKTDAQNGAMTPGERPAGPPAGSGSGSDSGTDTCPGAVIPGSPFGDNGDTTGATTTISVLPVTCNGNWTEADGPDHIYQLTPSGANSLSFTVTTADDNYDPSIYLVSICNDANSCVTGADNCWARNEGSNPCGAVSDESFTAPALTAGLTYYFYIDSWYSAGHTSGHGDGPYDFTLSGDWPVELMEFTVE